jgi:hypothetical protein
MHVLHRICLFIAAAGLADIDIPRRHVVDFVQQQLPATLVELGQP